MAAAAAEAAKASTPNVDSYVGSLIGLITKSDIRYQGFLFHLNAQETTIGLRHVKSFGTEGRRKDGPQVPPNDKIYEYIYFRGTDIKDLQVISPAPAQTTPSLPDDPAIIQSRLSHPTSTPAQVPILSAQSGFPTSSLQGNLSAHPSLENPVSWGSSLPSLPANTSRPAMPNYWPAVPGSSGGTSQYQQQNFPPPPQGLVVSQPLQQQSDNSTMNQSFAHHSVESPHTYMPPVCTGFLNFPPSVPPSSATQSNVGLFPMPAFNLSPGLMSNNTSSSPTMSLDMGSRMVSSSGTSLFVNTNVPPVGEAATSVPGPTLLNPSMLSTKSNTETTSASLDRTPLPSYLTPGPLLQPDLVELPSSYSLQTKNNDAELVKKSDLEPVSSELENAEEPGQGIAKPPDMTMRGASSSFQYHNRHNSRGRGDEIRKDVLHTPQSNRGHVRGGRVNGMHKDVLHTSQSYRGHPRGRVNEMHKDVFHTQSNRGHARGRVNGMHKDVFHTQSNRGHAQGRVNEMQKDVLHTPPSNRGHARGRINGLNKPSFHPHHNNRGLGRGTGPNGISLGNRLNRSHASGGSKVPHSVIKFTEDFDFEAMNEKFNKEQVWGLLGKSTKAGGSEEKEGDGEEAYGIDAQEEAGDGFLNADSKPGYCKDDFFDKLSCTVLDRDSGKGKVKLSERRRIDTETFGEINKNQRGRGIQGPRRAGGFQGSYRGRGFDSAGRGRGRAAWNRVTNT